MSLKQNSLNPTTQQLLVAHLTAAFLPDLGKLIVERRRMIAAEIDSVRKIGGEEKYLARLENLYLEREAQRDSLDKKHGWHECRPYILPTLLHLQMTVELAEHLKCQQNGDHDLADALGWLRDTPDRVTVIPVQSWSRTDFDDARNRTVRIELSDVNGHTQQRTILLRMAYTWDLISAIALDEELEKLRSTIESMYKEPQVRPMPDVGALDPEAGALDFEEQSEDINVGYRATVPALKLIESDDQIDMRLSELKSGLEEAGFIWAITFDSFKQIFMEEITAGSQRIHWKDSSSKNTFGVKKGTGALSFMLYFMWLLYEEYKVVEYPPEPYINLPNCFTFGSIDFPNAATMRTTYSHLKKEAKDKMWMKKMKTIFKNSFSIIGNIEK